MEDSVTVHRAARLSRALKYLSTLLVVTGVSLLTSVLFLVDRELLELVSDQIMMAGSAVMLIAAALLVLVVVSGLVSHFRVPYGWFFVFFTAATTLLMGLLMGTGTILPTLLSFSALMVLSLLLWATAIVYYFWDLYT